jgi:hypothetical protein
MSVSVPLAGSMLMDLRSPTIDVTTVGSTGESARAHPGVIYASVVEYTMIIRCITVVALSWRRTTVFGNTGREEERRRMQAPSSQVNGRSRLSTPRQLRMDQS